MEIYVWNVVGHVFDLKTAPKGFDDILVSIKKFFHTVWFAILVGVAWSFGKLEIRHVFVDAGQQI
jgi:hypothetical protein